MYATSYHLQCDVKESALLCFSPTVVLNFSECVCPNLTFHLAVSIHILIIAFDLAGIPNNSRCFHNASVLTESYAYLKSTNIKCNFLLNSQYLSLLVA